MGLTTKATGGTDFAIASEGTHLAICNMVVDLGLQVTSWEGETKNTPQVYIRFELPHERIDYTDAAGVAKEGPMTVGRIYTNSLGKKANLRRDLESWRGRNFTATELEGFDLTTVAGAGCQVTIVHNKKEDRTYANIASVAGWPKGMAQPQEPENPVIIYDADLSPSLGFDELPEWLQSKVKERIVPTMPGDAGADPDGMTTDDLDDTIPF